MGRFQPLERGLGFRVIFGIFSALERRILGIRRVCIYNGKENLEATRLE